MARRNRKAKKAGRKARTTKREPKQVQTIAMPEERQVEEPAAEPEPVVAEPVVPAAESVVVSPIVTIEDRERVTRPDLTAVQPEPEPEPEPEQAEARLVRDEEPEEDGERTSMELDDVDKAFFDEAERIEREQREKMESFPPVAEDVAKEALPPPSPALLARRRKLRKFVGAVVALGALFVIGGVGKSLLGSEREAAAEPAKVTVEDKAAEKAEAEAPAPVQQPDQPPVQQPAPPAAEPEEDGPAVAKTEAPETEADAPEPAAPAVEDPRAEALKLLNRGKMGDAIPMARAAIQKDPDHALGYLYLGTALQETGRHTDAVAAYSDCVRNAKKGPVWECRAMGGRK